MDHLKAAWFIARKDVRQMLRQRETLLWTFIMPPVFFFFIGTITAGFGGADGERERLALSAPADAGFLADQLALRLEQQGFAVERMPQPVPGASNAGLVATRTRHPEGSRGEAERAEGNGAAEDGSAPRRISVPAGFTDSVLAGRRVEVAFTTTAEEGLDARYDEVRAARAVYSVLADVVVTAESGARPTLDALATLAAAPRPLKLKVTEAGRRKEVPTGFEQAIPGTMVMFTLLVLLTSGAVLLVIEREQGLLRRLASTPQPRGGIVLGKWGGRLALGTVQIAFAMLAGTLLFRMRWGPDLPMILAVLLAWGALAAGLGLLLGNLARSEGQAVAIGVISSMVLAALGGCWWPIEVTPRWMQSLALLLPTGWTMDALHRLVSFQTGAAGALPHVGVLALAAATVGWVATRTFRFQ